MAVQSASKLMHGRVLTVAGPAILLEETATTYLDAEFTARPGEQGVLEITDDREAR